MFRELAPRQSEWLALESSACESLWWPIYLVNSVSNYSFFGTEVLNSFIRLKFVNPFCLIPCKSVCVHVANNRVDRRMNRL